MTSAHEASYSIYGYRHCNESFTALLPWMRGSIRQRFYQPNMHMHMHLKDSMVDFGRIYSFWLFSFERYNGLLGNIETNKKGAFEVTFVRRFLEETHSGDDVRSLERHFRMDKAFYDFLSAMVKETASTSTMARLTSADVIFDSEEFMKLSVELNHANDSEPLPPNAIENLRMTSTKICREHYLLLHRFYQVAYPNLEICDYMRPQLGCTVVSPEIRKFTNIKSTANCTDAQSQSHREVRSCKPCSHHLGAKKFRHGLDKLRISSSTT